MFGLPLRLVSRFSTVGCYPRYAASAPLELKLERANKRRALVQKVATGGLYVSTGLSVLLVNCVWFESILMPCTHFSLIALGLSTLTMAASWYTIKMPAMTRLNVKAKMSKLTKSDAESIIHEYLLDPKRFSEYFTISGWKKVSFTSQFETAVSKVPLYSSSLLLKSKFQHDYKLQTVFDNTLFVGLITSTIPLTISFLCMGPYAPGFTFAVTFFISLSIGATSLAFGERPTNTHLYNRVMKQQMLKKEADLILAESGLDVDQFDDYFEISGWKE